MKKNSILKILFICIAFVFVTTYIFKNDINEAGQMQYMAIWDSLKYPIVALEYFCYIPVFLLVVTGFYGVINKIGLYKNVVNSVVEKYKNESSKFVLLTFISILTINSFTNIGLGIFVFIPLIISIILAMKYDKIVAFMATFGAVLIANISNVFNYNVNNGLLNYFEVDIYETVWIRLFIYVTSIVISGFFLNCYMKNPFNKKDELLDDNIDGIIEENVKSDLKVKPFWIMFSIISIIIILGSFSWETLFNITIFTDITSNIQDFTIGDLSPYTTLIGYPPIFGNYGLTDYMVILIIAIVIIKFIYSISIDDMLDGFVDGLKSLVKPIFVFILVYVILVLGTYHPSYMYIVTYLNSLVSGFNLFIVSLMTVIMSLFNVDINLFVSNMAYLVISNVQDTALYPLITIVISSVFGLVMVVAPTSITLAFGLAYMDLNYVTWLKYIWKTILSITLLIFSILMIWSMILIFAS